MKKQVLSIGLSVLLTAALPLTSLAATSESLTFDDKTAHTIDSIDYTGTDYALKTGNSGTDVTVTGDIKSENGRGIQSAGGSSVAVEGNVVSNNTSVLPANNSNVTITGNIQTKDGYSIQAANESSTTIGGGITNQNGSGIRTDGNATVLVKGDITAGNGGINGWGDGSDDGKNASITVEGNVTGKVNGVDASNGVDVIVGGNVNSNGSGLYAGNTTDADNIKINGTNSITVNGNVFVRTEGSNYSYMGIGAMDNSTITVNGDVTLQDDANQFPWAIWSENSQVSVGNVTSNAGGIQSGASEENTALIEVKGDLTTGDGCISVQLWGNNATITVENDVQSDGTLFFDFKNSTGSDNELAIGGSIQNEDSQLKLRVGTDEDGNAINLPEIVVGEIDDIDNVQVIDGTNSPVSEETKKQVIESIKYIVSSNPDSLDGKGSFQITKLDGSALTRDKSGTYDVADTYETITIHVDVQSGYELASLTAGKSPVVKNADGSYSVTVQPGGGINIEALIRAIETNSVPDREDRSSIASASICSSWKLDNDGNWSYRDSYGRLIRSQWKFLEWNGRSDWYYFDQDGIMKIGWFQDTDGSWYFLNDGSFSDFPKGSFIENVPMSS